MPPTGKPLRPSSYVDGSSYAIVDRVTRLPVSFGTVISDDISDDYDVVEAFPPGRGQVWDPKTYKAVDYVPTADEVATEQARQASVANRAASATRLQELRGKVGPGKPGLTPSERDEVAVIQSLIDLNAF